MRNSVIIAVISLMLFGCKKDKFTTKPQLTFKKVNATVFSGIQKIQFTLGFTDAEGDFPGKIFIQRVNPGCAADSLFKDESSLPNFPTTSNFEGEIILTYSYAGNIGYPVIMNEPPGECSDTSNCYFRFALEDKAGNKSDTINSVNILFIKE